MAEVNPGIAGERWNRLILGSPEMLREMLTNAVRDLFQSGFALGTEPVRDRVAQVRAFTEKEPALLTLAADPATPQELKLRANAELLEGERLRREAFG